MFNRLGITRESARRFLAVFGFAFWVGGFFFYASVVVAVGSEVLGSKAEQGFITQKVTNWLNVSAVPVLGVLLWNAMACRQSTKRKSFICLAATWTLMVIVQGTLFVMHPILDQLLVPQTQVILQRRHFHGLHSVYLDLSTVQQFAALLHLWCMLNIWKAQDSAAVHQPLV